MLTRTHGCAAAGARAALLQRSQVRVASLPARHAPRHAQACAAAAASVDTTADACQPAAVQTCAPKRRHLCCGLARARAATVTLAPARARAVLLRVLATSGRSGHSARVMRCGSRSRKVRSQARAAAAQPPMLRHVRAQSRAWRRARCKRPWATAALASMLRPLPRCRWVCLLAPGCTRTSTRCAAGAAAAGAACRQHLGCARARAVRVLHREAAPGRGGRRRRHRGRGRGRRCGAGAHEAAGGAAALQRGALRGAGGDVARRRGRRAHGGRARGHRRPVCRVLR
jgi:hypothetical protein